MALFPALGVLALAASPQAIRIPSPLAHPIGGDVSGFRLLPDGSGGVYVADQRTDGLRELFAAPSDGSRASVRLSPDLEPGQEVLEDGLLLSPDGARVVFRVDVGFGQADLWSAPVDGGAPAVLLGRLLSPAASGYVFAPDGATLFLAADLEVATVLALYRVPADGSVPPERLSTPLTGDVRCFRGVPCLLTPDGGRAVYVADHELAGRTELYSVPTDGSSPAVRLNPTPVSGGAVESNWTGSPVQLSPDGTRAVYRADQTVDDRFELFSVPTDGSAPAVPISGTVGAGRDVLDEFTPGLVDIPAFRITADGSTVVFRANLGALSVYSLHAAPIDGSAPPVRVTPSNGQARSVREYALSPDGQSAVYVSDPDVSGTYELFAARIDGSGAPRRLSAPLVAQGDVDGGFGPSFAIGADARWVVYRADQEVDQRFELYRVPLAGRRALRRADGTTSGLESVRLSPTIVAEDVGAFRLAADGLHVVFEANAALHLAPLAEAGPLVRLDAPERPALEGTFQLAGAAPWLAYLGQAVPGTDELFAVALDSGAGQPVNGPLAPGSVAGDVVDFAFDPSGTHVVFRADGTVDEVLELYATRASGGAPVQRLSLPVTGSGVSSFRIHPDGAEVLYLGDHAGTDGPRPYAVPIEGGTPRAVGTPLPAGTLASALRLTDGGTRVAFLARAGAGQPARLLAAPFDGGAPPVELSLLAGQPVPTARFELATTGDRAAFVTDLLPGPKTLLYTVPIDHASDPVALTSTGLVVEVTFSPDGQEIVYGLQEGTLYSLFRVRADGSEPSVLLHGPVQNGFTAELRFAPDASRVAWIEGVSSFRTLYSASLVGPAATVPLSNGSVFGGAAFGSIRIGADPTRILFVSGSPGELRSAPLDGSGPILSLSGTGMGASEYALSPDGTTAAYWGDALGGGRGVHQVPVDGSAVPEPLALGFGPGAHGAVDFTADGARVLFALASGSPELQGPYAVPLDGSTAPARLGRIPEAGGLTPGSPSFLCSPDASRILYRAFRNAETEVNELYLALLERAPLPAGD